MHVDSIKLIQTGLNKHFNQQLTVDGIAGFNTFRAIDKISLIPMSWSNQRKLIGFIQVFALVEKLDAGPIDGYNGPQTEQAEDDLLELLSTGNRPNINWRKEEFTEDINPNNQVPLQNYKSMVKYYGEVGTNQTKVTVPHPLRLAWKTETTITKFTCHEKVADSIVRVLNRVIDHYGPDQYVSLGMDLWAGCLNVRKMRGGTKYSMHSWGTAIDWDSARNRLKWRSNKANFAKPIYEQWWKLWEEEQWTSLGREINRDYMHIQKCRLR